MLSKEQRSRAIILQNIMKKLDLEIKILFQEKYEINDVDDDDDDLKAIYNKMTEASDELKMILKDGGYDYKAWHIPLTEVYFEETSLFHS